MIVYAYLLLASIAISTANAECVDTEPFTFQGNTETMCAGSNCNKNKVKLSCPLTCGVCTPDSTGTDGDDSGTDCKDTEPFTFQGNKKTMCAGSDCNTNKVKSSCPLTCGLCTPDSSGTDKDDSGKDCKDIEPFTFQGNTETMCAGSNCNKNKVKSSCPLTCGLCTPDSSGTGGGDSGGGNSGGGDSGGGDSCEDAPKSFIPNGEVSKAKCKRWVLLCGIDTKVDTKCPKTCGLCGLGPPTDPPTTPCVDVSGKFKFGNARKNCRQVEKKKKKLCKKAPAIQNCPMTCGLCVTEFPTTSPSDVPSLDPTTSPSDVPSLAPTPSPSNAPSASPTRPQCTLKGAVKIPGMGDVEFGYHSASLRVSKGNWDVVCNSKKRKTGWGCVHDGDAKIGVWPEDDVGCKEDETATIEYAAGGTFSFTMEHVFHDYEVYYDDDHVIRPELTVTANEMEIVDGGFPYRYPANTNTDTHDSEGFTNGAYKGTVSANVVCDDECNCEAERVLPECLIRAEIRFPTIQAYNDKLLEDDDIKPAYHNDAISVSRDGAEEICSSSNPMSNWCVHEGDGKFYFKDYEHYYSDTESIVISASEGGKFLFEIRHDMSEDDENYYNVDEQGVSGEVHMWINNKKRPIFTHWVNGNYADNFYLDVECDDDCKCSVKQRKNPVCEIDAKLKFPNKEKVAYYGYKNDYMTVQKGGEIETCQWENIDAGTNWNCFHTGDAYVWNLPGPEPTFEKDVETVAISNAADGNYRLTLQHWPSNLELDYDEDHKISSTMSVSINGDEPEKFSYSIHSDIDTHLEDHSINPDYRGTLYVDIMCDPFCNCDMTERVPTCELNAELSFPDFADNNYGYRAEVVSVVRVGDDDVCGFYSPMTKWGCFSSGDAWINDENEPIDDYQYIKDSQVLNIPDASSGEFNFTVAFYDAELNPYYADARKFKSMLNITVNDEDKGTFKHALNITELTQDADGYTSEIYVVVACDENCSCEAKKHKNIL